MMGFQTDVDKIALSLGDSTNHFECYFQSR